MCVCVRACACVSVRARMGTQGVFCVHNVWLSMSCVAKAGRVCVCIYVCTCMSNPKTVYNVCMYVCMYIFVRVCVV